MKGDARPLPTIAFPPTQNSALKTLSTYTPARISPVFHEELARQLPDEAFHLQVEQRHGYRGGWQTAAADDVIDPNLLVAQRIVSFLLVQGEFQRGQDARLAGGGGLVAGGEKIFEFAENVLRPFAEFGPFLDEIVAAFAAGGIDATGHGEDLPAVFGREIGGDKGAAREVGLDHDRAQRHAGHDAVADGERLLVRRTVEGELRDDRAVGGDAGEEFRVLGRGDEVRAGAQHGDGAALGAEGTLMRGGIDAPRAPAHDGDAEVRELIGEFAGGLDAVRCGHARADEGDAIVIAAGEAALDVENHGRIVDLAQKGRVKVIGLDENFAAEIADALEFAGEVHGGFPGGDAGGQLLAEVADAEEFGARGGEDFLGFAKIFQQRTDPYRADAFDHVQCDERFPRIHRVEIAGGRRGRKVKARPSAFWASCYGVFSKCRFGCFQGELAGASFWTAGASAARPRFDRQCRQEGSGGAPAAGRVAAAPPPQYPAPKKPRDAA